MVAIKFDSNKFDRKQRRMLSRSKKSLDKLYEAFYKEVAKIGATTGFDDPERDFFLKDYPKADKAMQALLRKLCDRITGLIEDGCQKGWSISNAKNSALINALGNIVPNRKDFINRINMRSESALNSFQERKVNGLGLSERVWKSQQQVKGQIELALELGLAEGKSAPSLSRDVRSYLREPERLFRRVRDKKGHLRLSKSAAAYHPGQGVYRSSYKNALRMTVTENNIAYRTADFVQQQEMDFVIGIEIRLSDNHPCDDICDDLAGVYPKKFKFTGWHPFCRCYTIPKLAEREELNKWARMSKEERDGYHFKGEVRSMPKKFTDWVDRNAERIKSAKSLPYFIKDNFKDGDPAKELRWEGKNTIIDLELQPQIVKSVKTKHEVIMENAAKRRAARTSEQIVDIKDAWRERRLDAYDNRCDQLMKTLTYSQGQALPAMAKRQIALRNAISKDASVKEVEALFAKFKKGVKIQNEWDTQVWANFSKEQIANMRDIEKSLGIKKGRPMTYEEADRQSANPLHVNKYIADKKSKWVIPGTKIHVSLNPLYDETKHKPYAINCQTCAPAYVLREWGFNIYAKGNTGKLGDLSAYLSKGDNWLETWTDKNGSPVSITSFKEYLRAHPNWKHMTQKRYLQYFDDICKEEGIYEVGLSWESKGGHCTIVRRFSDGSIRYIEPQEDNSDGSGFEEEDIRYLCGKMKKHPILKDGAIKVDDKLLNMKYVSIFLK